MILLLFQALGVRIQVSVALPQVRFALSVSSDSAALSPAGAIAPNAVTVARTVIADLVTLDDGS